jgi:hypothetical protein
VLAHIRRETDIGGEPSAGATEADDPDAPTGDTPNGTDAEWNADAVDWGDPF